MNVTPALQRAFEQYVARRVLPELGSPRAAFALTATQLGVNSDVFFLDIAGRPPLVLKAIRRAGRFSSLLRCAALLAEHGFKVPPIVYARRASRLFDRLGRHIICEERIVGPTLAERGQSEALRTETARLFARLHRIQRTGWGPPDQRRSHGLYRLLCSKLQERLRAWRSCDSGLSPALAERMVAWLKPWQQQIEQISVFSLCHGDPNPGNLIIGPHDDIYLLDIGHIRYVPPALDFFTLQFNLCEDDARMAAAFEAAYRAGSSAQERSAFTTTQAFFKACVLVNFGSMLAEKLASGSLPEQAAGAGRRQPRSAARLLAEVVS